ncbi:MAG: SAM-dependent methyltransferase [Parachlamydiaceae bacterium]|nr:SAM-dependent methyltransferase [Parachlamydiaceae bacterium]
MSLFVAVLFMLAVVSAFSIIFWTLKNGISPMPTATKVKSELLKIELTLIPGPIYELGSGWGTLTFALAKKYPSHQVVAYETSLIPYLYCILKQYFYPQPNLHFHRLDFFHESLKEASLVICYLYPEAMQLLKDKFNEELPSGCFVISNTFAINEWHPLKAYPVDDMYHTKLYLYRYEQFP